MKKLGSLLIGLIILFGACSSDDTEILEARGTVIEDTDGTCGYMIQIGTDLFSPTYLPTQYREDALEVFVNFELLETTFDCDDGSQMISLRQIRIEQIRPVGN